MVKQTNKVSKARKSNKVRKSNKARKSNKVRKRCLVVLKKRGKQRGGSGSSATDFLQFAKWMKDQDLDSVYVIPPTIPPMRKSDFASTYPGAAVSPHIIRDKDNLKFETFKIDTREIKNFDKNKYTGKISSWANDFFKNAIEEIAKEIANKPQYSNIDDSRDEIEKNYKEYSLIMEGIIKESKNQVVAKEAKEAKKAREEKEAKEAQVTAQKTKKFESMLSLTPEELTKRRKRRANDWDYVHPPTKKKIGSVKEGSFEESNKDNRQGISEEFSKQLEEIKKRQTEEKRQEAEKKRQEEKYQLLKNNNLVNNDHVKRYINKQQKVERHNEDTEEDIHASQRGTYQPPSLGGGRKSKKTRKHRGIIQTGGNTGRLRKGYKYSGKRLKNGMPEILKVKSKK